MIIEARRYYPGLEPPQLDYLKYARSDFYGYYRATSLEEAKEVFPEKRWFIREVEVRPLPWRELTHDEYLRGC